MGTTWCYGPWPLLLYDHKITINVFQVALIVFLSHIGSFVPADAATVGLTDRYDFLVSHVFWNRNSSLILCMLILVITILMLTVFWGWGDNCRIFCATGSRLMTAEQSTFMIDLHQVGVMLRYAKEINTVVLDVSFFHVTRFINAAIWFHLNRQRIRNTVFKK